MKEDIYMIKLTRINGQDFYVNCDLVEFIETTPDTIISLTTGKKIIVRENAIEVINKVIDFKSKILKNWELLNK
jgi:flagellar protein FlbD